MRWEQPVQYGAISDIGFRRRNNEDSLVVQICPEPQTWSRRGHLFVVADGMGGHAVGELASKIATDTLPQSFYKSRGEDVSAALKEAIELTNGAIHERGTLNRDFARMGTTCSALVLSPEGALIGHVGDSRVYRVRDGRIDQLTFDHSLQWELLRQRKMSPDEVYVHEPRHVITRSLGPEPTVQVDTEGPYPVQSGDVFVICSDGLTGHVSDPEIGGVAEELSPGEACKLLVHLANLRGGADNISVIVVRVGRVASEIAGHSAPGESARSGSRGWWWLAAYWVIAATLVGGVLLTMFGRVAAGVGFMAAALLVVLSIFLSWFWKRVFRRRASKVRETILRRPHRSAPVALNRKLVGHLAAVDSELQRSALEEGWPIDWAQHEESSRNARTAFEKQKFSVAFREYARAIDALMCGLNQVRKQPGRDLRRVRPAAAPQQPDGG